MSLNYGNFIEEPNLTTTLESFEEYLKYSEINCCRVGIVESYDPDTRVAKVNIANKLTLSLQDNGAPVTSDYSPIFAKVLFFGWGDIGTTHPINQGMEGILLFNDREIESWYINGNINNLAYKRAHSKTDAIFIAGLLSLPNMIATLQDCLHFFYKETFLKLKENSIELETENIEENYKDKKETFETKEQNFTTKTMQGNITLTGNISQTGDTTVSGITTSGGLVDTTAASGQFTTADGKIVTVANGIVKTITQGS